jgi:hypothetical protein
MIETILNNWLAIAIVYGGIYATYLVYALYAIRFEDKRRVTKMDFQEMAVEAIYGPILLPCRIVKNFFMTIRASLLAIVNVGLPEEDIRK